MNENYYIIRTGFDLSAIPDSVHIAVGNRAADADVEISECTVRYNRARSFLLSTPGDVCVENSDLSSMMAGIRICGDANYWFESGRTRNVVIRNNRFGTMATGGRSPQAVLQIDPVISHDARSGDSVSRMYPFRRKPRGVVRQPVDLCSLGRFARHQQEPVRRFPPV